jgi:hypothetical protein
MARQQCGGPTLTAPSKELRALYTSFTLLTATHVPLTPDQEAHLARECLLRVENRQSLKQWVRTHFVVRVGLHVTWRTPLIELVFHYDSHCRIVVRVVQNRIAS